MKRQGLPQNFTFRSEAPRALTFRGGNSSSNFRRAQKYCLHQHL
jgi:hypothetical protein